MRILTIDGGGVRGLVPAIVLGEIERRVGRAIADCFDLIAGTSTGGVIAAVLAAPHPDDPGRPRFAAAELAGLYERQAPRIFHRDLIRRIKSADGYIDKRYDDDGLRAALAEFIGDAPLSSARTDLLIPAYEIGGRFAFFFRAHRARSDRTYDFGLADVTRATTAAPTYFAPAEVTDRAGDRTYALIDGGVFAINPAMCAIADVSRGEERPPVELMVSLGTGSLKRPFSLESAGGWGRIEWAPKIIDIVFDSVAETVDTQARRLLGDDHYVRLQTPLVDGASDALDNTKPDNVDALRRTGERLISERAAEIDRIVDVLNS